MVKLSQITPETTYADIKQQVEANLKEGFGIPYECLILMARSLDNLAKELERTKASLEDAKQRLPLDDANAERQRKRKTEAFEAAMRICDYLVTNKPHFMHGLVNDDKIDLDDFLLLLTYHGFSTYEYEG